MAYVSSIHKSKLKERAFELRRQRKSYNAISQKLAIPKSTLSGWFKLDPYSSQVKEILIKKARAKAVKKLRLMAQANKEKWQKLHLSYRNQAIQEFSGLISKPLFWTWFNNLLGGR